MVYLLPIVLFVLGISVILLVLRLWLNQLEQKSQTSDELVEWLKDLGNRVERSTNQVDQKLTKNMDMFNTRLDRAATVIGQVQKTIGEFSEIGRSMKELQDFLNSPKLRGNLGEHVLKDLLGQHFPKNSFVLQYVFKGGEKVDAVIKTANGLIPIDSKFPSDNFKKMQRSKNEQEQIIFRKDFERDVKKHIDDISKKYILVNENTVDYALMYIPSESIYYEIINSETLYEYASTRRVLIVSPMSFYAYMKAILMSFEGQRIESQAKIIMNTIRSIQKDYEKTEDAFSVLRKHITNAYKQLDDVDRSFGSLGQKISSTQLHAPVREEKLLE